MLKVYSKKLISTVVASSLALSLGIVAVDAAPKTSEQLTTGRTELKLATGAITVNPVPTLAHYATDVTLTGTVVIDGPKLVLLVNGQDVSAQAKLTKIADKTWTYAYTTTVGEQTGDVTFNIDAYTIYVNGKPAGDVHTRANSVGQTVHVPYVASYDYTNLTWNDYNRITNEFSFAYNLVKVWDDGEREVVAEPINANVKGTETYQNSGFEIKPPVVVQSFEATAETFSNYDRTNNTYDLTFDVIKHLSNGTQETTTVNETSIDASQAFVYTVSSEGLFATEESFTFAPPVTVKDYSVSVGTFGEYNATTNTYPLTFTLTKLLSTGIVETTDFTVDVTAGETYTYTASDERALGYTEDFSFTAPQAPTSPVVVIPSDVEGEVSATGYTWSGNNANGGNVLATYTLTYTINGTTYNKNLSFTFNPGTGFKNQELTYNTTYEGQSVAVTYNLLYVQPVSSNDSTNNKNK